MTPTPGTYRVARRDRDRWLGFRVWIGAPLHRESGWDVTKPWIKPTPRLLDRPHRLQACLDGVLAPADVPDGDVCEPVTIQVYRWLIRYGAWLRSSELREPPAIRRARQEAAFAGRPFTVTEIPRDGARSRFVIGDLATAPAIF
jgi:hypothetical protein